MAPNRTQRRQQKAWFKLWKKRQSRMKFYEALLSFQQRNHLNQLSKNSKKKIVVYKQRMNLMFEQKLKTYFRKIKVLKNKAIKFQLKYGIYFE